MKKDFLSIKDLTRDEVESLLEKALGMKRAGKKYPRSLTGYTLGLLFEKASTRTRVSFESAMYRLGGQTLFLSSRDTQLSRGEPVKDTARVLSRYLDGLSIRTYSQGVVEEMARWADIPVINALTDKYHPCQVLSDLMTVQEKKGRLEGLKIAWVGDGNNMANSWINAARIMGFHLSLACPAGYEPDGDVLSGAGENIRLTPDPKEAVRGADVINTDVWASMGLEKEQEKRIRDFAGFQVNENLVKRAKPDVVVLHCLPAHRGEEIAEEVLEGPRSVVFDQAENKMHLHQALLEQLIREPA
ncbi:MAG: ornithine carbamoyltransferase [Desulfobacteraceae bacterium 4484_190.3]|nr:MAG: ornithine carbamoyltransferase [Desulfobacteraceae bacterium 4484_190.3]